MARIKGAMMTRKRRKKTVKLAKGYFGAKSKLFKMAKQAVMKSGQYAYIGRKQRKRDFRRLWITRISAAAKLNGMNYSTFMNGLKKANVTLNRKMLAEIAVSDAAAFTALAEKAKAALEKAIGAPADYRRAHLLSARSALGASQQPGNRSEKGYATNDHHQPGQPDDPSDAAAALRREGAPEGRTVRHRGGAAVRRRRDIGGGDTIRSPHRRGGGSVCRTGRRDREAVRPTL